MPIGFWMGIVVQYIYNYKMNLKKYATTKTPALIMDIYDYVNQGATIVQP